MSNVPFLSNMADALKILPISVNHSYSAIEHLKSTIDQIQPSIIALQEPYYHNNQIIGFSLKDIVIRQKEQPHTAMVVRGMNIDVFPERVNRDLISLRLFTRLRIVNVCSPPNKNIEITLDQLGEIVTTLMQSTRLGAENSDDKGDNVTQFLINNYFHILNKKEQGLTFESCRGSSFID
ncbi:unnamed protein product [Ixodes hexagonus]